MKTAYLKSVGNDSSESESKGFDILTFILLGVERGHL